MRLVVSAKRYVLNEDITAFVPSRYLEKEDGSKLKKGEEAEFVIIEFSKEFKRVVASHTLTFKSEELRNSQKNSKKSTSSVKSAPESKTTLGDANEALKALKDKMDSE